MTHTNPDGEIEVYNKISEIIRYNGFNLSNDEAIKALSELFRSFKHQWQLEGAKKVRSYMSEASSTDDEYLDWEEAVAITDLVISRFTNPDTTKEKEDE